MITCERLTQAHNEKTALKRHMYVGPQIVGPQTVGPQSVATQYTVSSQTVVTLTMPLNPVV